MYNIYGFAQSEKFPDAKQRNHSLLSNIVKHIQDSPDGPCLLVGDFNLKVEEESTFHELQLAGWREVSIEHAFRTGLRLALLAKMLLEQI